MVARLDDGLRHLSGRIKSDLKKDVSGIPGAGAAGAMGAGAVAFFGAWLKSGIEAVLDITGFDDRIKGTDLIIIGEGRIDNQSIHGKVISGIAARTEKTGVRLYAIVGGIGDDLLENPKNTCLDKPYLGRHKAYKLAGPKIDAIFSTNINGLSYEEILSSGRTARDYEETLRAALKWQGRRTGRTGDGSLCAFKSYNDLIQYYYADIQICRKTEPDDIRYLEQCCRLVTFFEKNSHYDYCNKHQY